MGSLQTRVQSPHVCVHSSAIELHVQRIHRHGQLHPDDLIFVVKFCNYLTIKTSLDSQTDGQSPQLNCSLCTYIKGNCKAYKEDGIALHRQRPCISICLCKLQATKHSLTHSLTHSLSLPPSLPPSALQRLQPEQAKLHSTYPSKQMICECPVTVCAICRARSFASDLCSAEENVSSYLKLREEISQKRRATQEEEIFLQFSHCKLPRIGEETGGELLWKGGTQTLCICHDPIIKEP